MNRNNEDAISPVVGVILMIVVTIIIAAVVSGFAGGFMKGQVKTPQATIQGKFSVTSGLQFTHAGGDPIPSADMMITVKNGPTFGSGLEAMSTNVLNLSNVSNSAYIPVLFTNAGNVDGYNITSFNPGDTWHVDNNPYCNPSALQPTVASSHGIYTFDKVSSRWSFAQNDPTAPPDSFWALDFVNPANIGKSFYLDVSDKRNGALISRAVIQIGA